MGTEEGGNGGEQAPPAAESNLSEGAQVALLAFRAAFAEVQRLSTAAEDESAAPDEEAMRAAKAKLAAAMRNATLAGVSEQTLLEASAPPEEEEEPPQPEEPKVTEGELKNGSRVEIFGLESESGKALNGQAGRIVGFLEEKGRYQVMLAPGKVVSVRPEHLKQLPADSGPKPEPDAGGTEASGHAFAAGQRVEVHGLESEAGRKLNERVGITKEFLADKGRWKIQMEDTKEVVSVRPANLTFVEKASEGSASSSSSSSRSEKPKAKKRKRSSGANPEEALEAMLKGERVRDDRRKKSARDAGAAAARFAHEDNSGTLQPGDRVEVVGLQSAGGKALNGKQGVITKWDEMKGRFQVDLFMANLQSLKPENLKQVVAGGAQRTHSPDAGGCGEFESYSGSTAGYTLL